MGSDEHRLRRFAAARRARDEDGMRRWWDELMADGLDRVTESVAVWGRGGRLSPAEQDEAVSLALVKAYKNMIWTFEGSTTGAWVNAIRSCAAFACQDVVRDAAERGRRRVTLDEPWDEAPVARQAHEAAEEQAEREELLAWALPRIADPRRRTVLQRTLDGVPAAAIAEELGVTVANLYQLRSRALRDLAALKEQWDA